MKVRTVVRAVLFSAVLSPFFVPALPSSSPPEPGADLGASAQLIEIQGEGSAAPSARVRLDLLSSRRDAVAEITLAAEAGGPGAAVLARAELARGRSRPMTVEVPLDAGRENHLFFRIAAKGADGSTDLSTLYLRVNLDPDLEPQLVGDYWQYQGATLLEDPS